MKHSFLQWQWHISTLSKYINSLTDSKKMSKPTLVQTNQQTQSCIQIISFLLLSFFKFFNQHQKVRWVQILWTSQVKKITKSPNRQDSVCQNDHRKNMVRSRHIQCQFAVWLFTVDTIMGRAPRCFFGTKEYKRSYNELLNHLSLFNFRILPGLLRKIKETNQGINSCSIY